MNFYRITFILIILWVFYMQPVSRAQNMPEMPEKDEQVVVDFNSADKIKNWWIVNDGVMGGISSSEIVAGDSGTAIFRGSVSLANNGGFASVRTRSGSHNYKDYTGVVVRVRGDGNKYHFRIRTNDRFDGISYRYIFPTESGIWQNIYLPFSEFVPVYRGRILKDVESLAPDKIQQLGLLIADKQVGKFRIEIDWIKTYK